MKCTKVLNLAEETSTSDVISRDAQDGTKVRLLGTLHTN